ncbi:hypothetical protein E4K10_46355 [Streptomyces sp. T1317-0309]|nr:hypothetical protein E4K10_46355 [Streptomyces sp. T1317-0309]
MGSHPDRRSERARIVGTRVTPADLHDRQAELREQERRREAARMAAEAELAREAERAELTGRWGLDRYAPAPRPEPEQPRRWASREPEHIHEAQVDERRRIDMPATRRQPRRPTRRPWPGPAPRSAPGAAADELPTLSGGCRTVR